MSLLTNKDIKESTEREELTTEGELLEKQRVATRAYQKERRDKHLSNWQDQKAFIDKLNNEELSEYLSNNENENEIRVGVHSIKVNPFEHALIKKVIDLKGFKSSRELYISICKSILENENSK